MRKAFIFALLLGAAVLAQDIIINDFDGQFSNADPEDIKPSAAVSMINVGSKNGRLIKTFGIGRKIDSATVANIRALVTLSDNNITWDSVTAGRAYVVAAVAPDSGRVTLYVWDGGKHWDSLTVAGGDLKTDFPATYFDTAYTQIIKDASTLRLLPGNKATMSGSACKGIWLGYVSRSYYENQFTPDTGWYAYNTPLAVPALTVTTDTFWVSSDGVTSGYAIDAPNRYYKFSYVYDDNQEGMLSAYTFVPEKDSMVTRLSFPIDTLLNKRLTAINVYRSINNADFYLMTTVSLTRTQADHISNPTINGTYHAYIPSMVTYPFCDTSFISVRTTSTDSTLRIIGDWHHIFKTGKYFIGRWDIGPEKYSVYKCAKDATYSADTTRIIAVDCFLGTAPPSSLDSICRDATGTSAKNCYLLKGSDTLVFAAESIAYVNHAGYDSIYCGAALTLNHFNTSYGLYYEGSAAIAPARSGTDFSWGNRTLILDTTYADDELAGGIVMYYNTANNAFKSYLIKDNYGSAVQVWGDSLGPVNNENRNCVILKPNDGLYAFRPRAYGTFPDTMDIHVYDIGATGTTAYPLAGQTSIDVNGKYARAIGGRMWQGNLVVDPYGSAKATHADWGSYSELDQYDVTPNREQQFIKFGDGGGGGITGISETFNGYPVFFKRNSCFTVNTSSATPSNWQIIKASHQLGNIAERGLINVRGDVYCVAEDKCIYRLRANNLAESDQTPTERLRVSEDIQDVFDGFSTTQMEGAIAGYDQKNDEIIWAIQFDSNATVQCSALADCYIAADEESSTNYGSSTYVAFPLDQLISSVGLIKFDFSNIPSQATVSIASMIMKKIVTGCVGPYTFNAYRLKRAWTESGAKWNVYTGTSAWGTAGAGNTTTDREATDLSASTFTDAAEWDTFAITAASVSQMCGTTPTFTNNGFYITGSTDCSGGHSFFARHTSGSKPFMSITYKLIYSRYFAYNTTSGKWREITSDVSALIFTPDENGNLLAYDSTAHKVYSTDKPESTTFTWKSRVFPVNDDEPVQVGKYFYLTYQSPCSLRVMSYVDNKTVPEDTMYFPDTSTVSTVKRKIGRVRDVRGKKYQFKIDGMHPDSSGTTWITRARVSQ